MCHITHRLRGRLLSLLLQIAHQRLGNRLRSNPAEIKPLYARKNRCRHLLWVCCRQNENHMCRRLLQCFQKRIERRRRKHVYLVNDIDLIFPLCRRIFHFLANLADVVHTVVGGRVNLNHVDTSPCQNILTNGTLVAGLAVRRGVRAVDGSGKNLRRRGFPCAPCAAKQIRMGHTPRFHLIFQRSDDMLLPDDALKRLWAEFSI